MLKRRIKDIIGPNLIGVSPETPLAEAVGIMRDNAVSCLPVLRDGKPVGIFTERNLLRLFASFGDTAFGQPIGEVMTEPVLTATGDMFVYDAFHVFNMNNIRHLVVVDEQGGTQGVLTFSDLAELVRDEDKLDLPPLQEVMNRVVHCVERDKPVRHVMAEMADLGISCAVFTKDRRALGILTERDVARLVIGQANLDSVTISQAMTRPVITVKRSGHIQEVARVMREAGIRRVVVVDEDDSLAGILTLSDIVTALELRFFSMMRDVIRDKEDELRTALHGLESQRLFLDHILSSSVDIGIAAADERLRVVFFNPAAESMLGLKAREVLGRDLSQLRALHGLPPERMALVVDRSREQYVHTFTMKRCVNGDMRTIQGCLSCMRDHGGNVAGYAVILRDVTEIRRAEEKLRFMAYHDTLTGLPNRVSFNERMDVELAHAERQGQVLAVVMVDLDLFKAVNDSMGHLAGDILLQQVAGRLKNVLRKSDTVARIGGDEFLLLLPDVHDAADAGRLAGKIVEALPQPFSVQGHEVRISASVGVSLYPVHANTAKALVKAADKSMYKAKRLGRANGRSNYVLAGPGR